MATSPDQYRPHVGDGVVLYNRSRKPYRGVVRSVNTDTYTAQRLGLSVAEAPVVSVTVDTGRTGGWQEFMAGHFRQETFLEYLTRPSGMGRWSWPSAVLIILGSLLLAWFAYTEPVDELGARIAVRAFVPIMWAVIIIGHYGNYTRRIV